MNILTPCEPDYTFIRTCIDKSNFLSKEYLSKNDNEKTH